MPTIDQLTPAAAIVAADELPVSQAGILHRATVAQLTAGLQPQIAVTSGQILGRVSPGIGSPEPISLGANLSLVQGTLSATVAPAPIGTLPAGSVPGPTDLVALSQGNADVAVTYAQLWAGLAGQGVDLSAAAVKATATSTPRRLADLTADAVTPEAFGAKGDGSTDDTAALAAAIASGLPVRLGARTYLVTGQWTIATADTTLIGIPGRTTIRRAAQANGGAFVAIQAEDFHADGIIFDANQAVTGSDTWGVLVTNACLHAEFDRCAFIGATGPTLGCGLAFQSTDPAVSRHRVSDCEFADNALHGLWVQACAGVAISGSRAHDNGQYGLCLDYDDPTFTQKVRLAQITGCRAWNNQRGISVGNYNAANTPTPVWGNANPDAIAILIADNVCHDNAIYGIAAAGHALAINSNTLSNNGATSNDGAAILANVTTSRVADNMITGTATFGIDAGGAQATVIQSNYVDANTYGINCGGGTNVRVTGNTVQNSVAWAIVANNVETDGHGRNFGVACRNLVITGNWLGLAAPSSGGVLLRDGPACVVVSANDFVGAPGALAGNALWPATDTVVIEANRWNLAPRLTCNPIAAAGTQRLVVPDAVDTAMITTAPAAIGSIVSSYQALTEGQISFVRVTAAGANYTTASVAIGGPGTGAQASAVLSNGAVIGIVVTAPGSNYGAVGAQIPVAITGDGAGAQAVAYASVPVPEERRLRLRCNVPVTFSRAGSWPVQDNWTLADLTVPFGGDVDWVGTWGEWRAVRATPAP